MQCFLDSIHLSSHSSRSSCLVLPTQVCVFFPWRTVCAAHSSTLRCVAIPPGKANTIKTNWFLTPQAGAFSLQFLSYGLGMHLQLPSSCSNISGLSQHKFCVCYLNCYEFIHVTSLQSCACYLNCYECICATVLLCTELTVSLSVTCGSHKLPTPCPTMTPRLLGML